MNISQIPALDENIERILKEECQRHKVNMGIPEEVGSRLTQTKYPNGNMVWHIDKKPVLRLTVIHKPTKIVFELQRVASSVLLVSNNIEIGAN